MEKWKFVVAQEVLDYLEKQPVDINTGDKDEAIGLIGHLIDIEIS